MFASSCKYLSHHDPKKPSPYERNFVFVDLEGDDVVFYQSMSMDGSTLPHKSSFTVMSPNNSEIWSFILDIRDNNPKREYCFDNYRRILSKVTYGTLPDCEEETSSPEQLELGVKYSIHGYVYINGKYKRPYFILTDCNEDKKELCLDTNAPATAEIKNNLKKAAEHSSEHGNTGNKRTR